jgi:hypothetical protein
MSPTQQTRVALQRVTDPNHKGQPAAVTARDPAPTLRTEPVDIALRAWLEGPATAPFLSTATQLYSWMRQNLITAADPSTAKLAAEAASARPDAWHAESLMQAAHRSGWPAAAPALYRARGPPKLPEGHHPCINTDNLYAAHKGSCPECTNDKPCYTAAACNLLAEVTWPWENATPPPTSTAPPKPIPYDEQTATLVKELMGIGALGQRDPSFIKAYSHVFDAAKLEPSLPEELVAAILHDPTGSTAAAAATARADAFLRSFTQRAAAPTDTDAVHAAWLAAKQAAGDVPKHRLVTDMSRLTHKFLKLPLRFTSINSLLRETRRGNFIAKLDLAKGYYLLRLAEEASDFCGVCIQLQPDAPPTYLTYRRLPMGASPSAFIFSLLTALVREIAQRHCPGVKWYVYLDDFFLLAPTMEEANAARELFLHILADLGLADNPKKRSGPSTCESVLGTIIDTRSMTISISPAATVKFSSLALVLNACSAQSLPVPAAALAQLAGYSVWAGTVDEVLPPFTTNIAASTGGLQPHWWRSHRSTFNWDGGNATAGLRADLKWLVHHITTHGLRRKRLLNPQPTNYVFSTSDASGPANAVAVVTEGVAWRFHLPDCSGIKVAILEALGPLLLHAHTNGALQGTHSWHASDALSACFWTATGKAKDQAANDLQRLLRLARANGKLTCTPSWLGRSDNFLADRGAAKPWREAAHDLGDIALPHLLVDVTVRGLPPVFLGPWASSIDAGFEFTPGVWEARHERGAT